ncbi:MAG: DNA polymerase III subunit delta [Oscillospiraceae bacterium]
MATKKDSYQKLKKDLAEGTTAPIYLFHGEETYLREHYLEQLRKKLVPPGFEEFNYHRLDGKGLLVQALAEVTEALPMLSDRTLVTVTDYDIFKLNEEQRTRLIALLEDFPPFCCLVFIYSGIPYKPSAVYKKLTRALTDFVQVVEFEPQGSGDLVNWVSRRFRAMDKDIDKQTAEHLIFTCGGLMTGLVPEIAKIGSYAKGKAITIADINAVADPVLSARVFDMTGALTANRYEQAAAILGDLLKEQTEPLMILAVIGKEMRKIYTARIAIDGGRDKYWLMELWNMRSDYPARLLMDVARKTTRDWCGNAVKLCQRLDRRMKSETGIDGVGELKLLLAQLGATRT